jgi:hypothetical protein
VKITVEIHDALFTAVKKYAAAHGLTFRELIETSLRHTLEKQSSARKPFRLRKVTFNGKGQRVRDGETIRALIYQGRGG